MPDAPDADLTDDAARPWVIVLFGATGDLAARKLFPGFYKLLAAGRMPEKFRIIGSGRHSPGSNEEFQQHVRGGLDDTIDQLDDQVADRLIDSVSFVVSDSDDGADLATHVAAAEQELSGDDPSEVRRLIYLSIPPSAMTDMIAMLGREKLTDRARLVIEKPFGLDTKSAKVLADALHDVVDESAVFRIDHFLGKEAVQNVLALRFANGLFEPAWNRASVASVQIDVPETLGLEGRGSFYEGTGCLRDMISTHLCQLLGFVAMEDPGSLDEKALRDAKSAALADLRPFDRERSVFGQYDGYRDEDDVADDSTVETFVALETFVDNDRWRDVPFYLRTGKHLPDDRRVITLRFKDPESDVFGAEPGRNELVLELTDDPVVTVDLRAKRPGPGFALADASMTVDVAEEVRDATPLEAYERLLLDVLHGDQTLFARDDEIIRLWEVCQPLLDNPPPTQSYPRGTWGPQAAIDLPEGGWRL